MHPIHTKPDGAGEHVANPDTCGGAVHIAREYHTVTNQSDTAKDFSGVSFIVDRWTLRLALMAGICVATLFVLQGCNTVTGVASDLAGASRGIANALVGSER